jgi:predicted enzyme related to lactoylglutathione lyase
MKRIAKSAVILGMALLLALQANAQVSFNAARVLADDVLATADFYKAAFGLHEVQRLDLPDGNVEVMLNFGSTPQEALANRNAQVVIMHREPGAAPDPVAHLIFNVTDMDSTVAAVKAAGGAVPNPPFEYGDTGIWIGMVNDPAGNVVELLKFP